MGGATILVAELWCLALVQLGRRLDVKNIKMSLALRSGEFVSWRFDLQHGGIGTIPVENTPWRKILLSLRCQHASLIDDAHPFT